MLTNAQALAALQRFESKARRENISCHVYNQNTIFTVYHTPAQPEPFQYRWGMNMVERHTALRVVQTFEEGARR